MHGELMELNDRLQRSLLNKESTIKRLRAELELLRGPLPDSDDDSISPALVNLWIPSVFLAGRSHSPHHVYQVISWLYKVFSFSNDELTVKYSLLQRKNCRR